MTKPGVGTGARLGPQKPRHFYCPWEYSNAFSAILVEKMLKRCVCFRARGRVGKLNPPPELNPGLTRV